jgi:uncharacterized protein with GYD domain
VPKYMFQGSYTPSGAAGLRKEGGSGRRTATEQLLKSVGGKLEAYYFAFGGDDFVLIADLPGNAEAAAVSLAGGASGAINVRTTVLLTPDEMDAAARTSTTYRAPGG